MCQSLLLRLSDRILVASLHLLVRHSTTDLRGALQQLLSLQEPISTSFPEIAGTGLCLGLSGSPPLVSAKGEESCTLLEIRLIKLAISHWGH